MGNLDFSPGEQGIICPNCGTGRWEHAGSHYGTRGQYDLYYCANNIERQYSHSPDEVTGNETSYCHGMIHVHEDGRVTVSDGDDVGLIREGSTSRGPN